MRETKVNFDGHYPYVRLAGAEKEYAVSYRMCLSISIIDASASGAINPPTM